MVVHAFNPSGPKAEAGRSLASLIYKASGQLELNKETLS